MKHIWDTIKKEIQFVELCLQPVCALSDEFAVYSDESNLKYVSQSISYTASEENLTRMISKGGDRRGEWMVIAAEN